MIRAGLPAYGVLPTGTAQDVRGIIWFQLVPSDSGNDQAEPSGELGASDSSPRISLSDPLGTIESSALSSELSSLPDSLSWLSGKLDLPAPPIAARMSATGTNVSSHLDVLLKEIERTFNFFSCMACRFKVVYCGICTAFLAKNIRFHRWMSLTCFILGIRWAC